MIKLPVGDIVAKIVEQKGVSESEVKDKIKSKMAQLSGLISEEGAAHIIANELNVKLFDLNNLKIKEVAAGMRNIDIVGKVTRKFELREFNVGDRSGKVGNLMIGDETGQMKVVFWNDQTKIFDELKDGDIVKIGQGYVKDNLGRKELHVNDRSKIEINPAGVNIEVREYSNEWVRKSISEAQETDANLEILATIVQVFDIRFFEPKNFAPGEQGYSYVLNIILDDGTDTIRSVFWKQQIQRLLEMEDSEIQKYRENPASFEDVKNKLLGEIVKLRGRIQKNPQLDNLEFVPNIVLKNPDPNEEIDRLKSDQPSAAKEEPKAEQAPTKEVPKKEEMSAAKAVEEANKDMGLEEEPVSIDELDFDDEK